MNWLLDPIKDHYVDFDGRATRQQYWMFFLMVFIASIVLSIVDGVLSTNAVLVGLFQLAVFLPSIAIAIRRLHDIDKSGWWLLISFVPIVGAIILIVLLVLKGDATPNKYGLPVGSQGAAPAQPFAPAASVPSPQNDVQSQNQFSPEQKID